MNTGLTKADIELFSKVTQASSARPHLVSIRSGFTGRNIVTLHTAKAISEKKDRKALLSEMRATGVKASYRIKSYGDKKLAKAVSLEKLNALYGKDDILLDPMGAFSRSRALVEFSKTVRERLEKKVAGVYWQAQWRSLYVVLDHKQYFSDNKAKRAELAEAEAVVQQVLQDTCGDKAADYIHAVRLSFEVPAMKLVPVDSESYWNKQGLMTRIRKNFQAPAFATMLGLAGGMGATQALAADPNADQPFLSSPAVSAVNGKIAISGGNVDTDVGDDSFGMISGSITVPIEERLGLQIDGAVADLDDADFWGVGAHLFWRDPDEALFGIIGGYGELDQDSALFLDQDIGFLGVEAEIYLDEFTWAATAGGLFGDNVDDGFAGTIDFGWYATDNLFLTVGAATSPEVDIVGTATIEWQPAFDGVTGLSFFAEGAVGEDDFSSINAGIRFYFGQGPTLKDRHRKDDPNLNVSSSKLTKGSAKKKKSKSESSSYVKGST
ncbi:MAG: hypothetical protein AAF423_00435 [Pseudomonadota bacterium]